MRRFARELGNASRKDFVKHLGVEIEFRVVLVRSDGHQFRVISFMQLGFDFLDLVLLDEKKVAVDLIRHVIVLVVAYLGEIAQHPG